MPKEQNIKQAQNIINEISDRRHWLLWHNQAFRIDLESLIKKTGIKLWNTHPLWRSFQPLPDGNRIGKDHPLWQQFYAKWGIGQFWHNGEIIQRFGERPLGIELIENNGHAEYIRLIIWPGEVNKKRISESWDYIEHLIETYFDKKKNPPWSLKVNNFWRDAKWYNLKWRDTHWNESAEKIVDLMEGDSLYKEHSLKSYESFTEEKGDYKKSLIKKILRHTKQRHPLIFDRLFLEQLINQHKKGLKYRLLAAVDPDRRIAINAKHDTLNILLYHFGILAIANTKIDWGEDFPYHKLSMVEIPELYSKLRKAGNFFVRYDFLKSEEKRFLVTEEEKIALQNKRKIREEFEADQKAFLLDEPGWTDAAFIIKEAILQMQKRIDSMA